MDWTDGSDRYLAEWRGETADCRPRCRVCGETLEPDSGACASAACTEPRLPCPCCDGPVIEGEGALCDDCRAAEIRAFTRPR